MRVCRFCAEEIQDAAITCKHCGRDVPHQESTRNPSLSTAGGLPIPSSTSVFILVVLAAVLAVLAWPTDGPLTPATVVPDVRQPPPAGVTYRNFERLKIGMVYPEVVNILGGSGTEMSRTGSGDTETILYAWPAPNGFANVTAMFQDGKLITKAQLGLQ